MICGQGPAPAGATIAHYRGEGLDMVPGTGLLAACVPGMFDTWMLLLRDYGTMRLADVLTPAIGYAGSGHPLVERANATIALVAKLFREHWPTSAAVYLPGGKVPEVGTLFTNKTLAATYARVLREAESAGGDRVAQIERARKAWSQGFVAEAIDRFCRTQAVMDTSGAPHRGVLTGDDMARWQAQVEPPLTYDYGRYTVCKTGPWGQGPVMLQQLALLKGFDARRPRSRRARTSSICWSSARSSPMPTARHSTAIPTSSRSRWRRCCRTPTTPSAASSSRERASHELLPGSVEGFGAVVKLRRAEGAREAVGAFGAGEPTVGRLGEVVGDTVHFDVVDQAGNMVSSTPSGGWLQSSPVIPELGFCLGTRAQMFWLEEGHPAALAPGKRPRTTLTPTLALRDGEPYLAWGSPGGDQQDQWTTQFFLRHVHAGMNLQEAIDAPAWHSEHFPISFWPRTARPGVLVVEGRVPKATVAELQAPRPHRRGRTRLVGRPAHRRRRATAGAAAPPPIRAACRVTPRGGEFVVR